MKRKATSGMMLTLLLIGMLSLAFNIQQAMADPKTIYVDDDNTSGIEDGSLQYPYNTIQEGVSAASSLDTVYVFSGHYKESVYIGKSLKLRGENRDTTIIDGEGWRYRVVHLDYVNNAEIAGFTVKNADYFGIHVTHSTYNLISGNLITSNKRDGLLLQYSHHNTVLNNTVSNNNVLGDGGGIASGYSTYNLIQNNTVYGTQQYDGIRLHVGDDYTHIIDNVVYSNQRHGIRAGYCHHLVIENTVVRDSGSDGILFDYGTDYAVIKNCSIYSNEGGGIGMYGWAASYTTIENCSIYSNDSDGIGLGGYQQTIRGNTLLNNGRWGIVAGEGCGSAKINHNNFMNNQAAQAYDLGSNNAWHDGYPSGGNYWSDYSLRYPTVKDDYQGVDQDIPGSDGIWDSPYTIGVNNRDRYPLVNPCGPDTTPPVANAGPDQTVYEDTLVTFDGSGSSDNVGIVSYVWIFTDVIPQTLTGVNPTYTFTTPSIYIVTLTVTDAAGNYATDTVTITVLRRLLIASIDIDPDTLNLRSHGEWITAYIQLPQGHNTADIDPTTILLNETIQPILDSKYSFVTDPNVYLVDHDNDGILERMVKFNRTEVSAFIIESFDADDWGFENVTLTITGSLLDETDFTGSYILRTVKGDVNGDGAVDIIDLSTVAVAYGSFQGERPYNPEADIDQDGSIDIFDIALVTIEYGTTCP